jgi:hypothetical protein
MPSDFAVTVTASGGMLPVSWEATYALSGCRYRLHDQSHGQPIERDIKFTVPEETLRSLYRRMVEGRFDQIGTHHEVIYDRGGFQVTVTAAGRTYTVVDGGQTVVDAYWLPSWKTIYEELARLEQEARERAVPQPKS